MIAPAEKGTSIDWRLTSRYPPAGAGILPSL
jgi:hypothetical protein